MNERMYMYWKEKIVKYLKRRKKVSLDKMVKDFGVPKTTLFKWITILELRNDIKTYIGNDRKKYIELVKK